MEKFFGDYLEKHFQMIYLDQRGVGRSSSPGDGNFSMDRMVRDFEEIRQALGISQWLTLGHSFGGILQMGYWEKYPQKIKGMIMINCTVSMEDSFGKSWLQKAAEFTGTEYRPVQTFTPDTLMSRLMEVSRALDEQGVRWKMTFVSPEDEKLINDTYNGFPSWNSDFGNQAMFIQDYWNDYRDLTKEVKVPVLFYYGKNDWPVGPEHYKGIGFPNMILRGSDVIHFPFLEDPEDLEEAIDTFIHQFSF
jgi:proline iminopeptidase